MGERIGTEALVLQCLDYSETSQIVVLYTRAAGQVRAIAKGSKRPRSPFGGALDALGRGTVEYVEKPHGRLAILTECTIRETYPALRRELHALRRAEYLAEVLMALTPEPEPQADLYEVAAQGLDRLNAGGGAKALCAFEAQMLRILGYVPRTRRCAPCGRGLPATGRVPFSFQLGGSACRSCAPRDPRHVEVDRGALGLLAGLAGGGVTRLERLRTPDGQIFELRRLLTWWVSHLMGRRPRTARYLPELAAARTREVSGTRSSEGSGIRSAVGAGSPS